MIALYERVSTDLQAEKGHSIEEQQDRLEKYAAALDLKGVHHYTDAGFSGANLDRPALQKLIKDVKAGKIEKVIVYKLDRLSRSQKDTLMLIEDIFLANGCDFLSVCENFDTASPFGRAMIGILSVFAQLEREQIKERMAMGKLARAKEGKFHGSRNVPIGYDYKDGELVTNDYEKIQVIRLFEEFVAGKPVNRIVREMNEEGFSTKYGKWTATTARSVLTHRTYTGYLTFRGEWYQGTHEAFFSDEMWEKAQAVFQQRRHDLENQGVRCGKANSFLGGYAYCKNCGGKLVKNQCRQYAYYKCKGDKEDLRSCRKKTWRVKELDDLIFGEIRKLALDCPILPEKDEKVENIERDAIKAKMGEIERKIDRLLELYSVKDMPVDALQEKIVELSTQKAKLERQLEAVRDPAPRMTEKEIVSLAESLDDVIAGGDVDEVRAIVSALIEKIVVDGEDVEIFWRFS